jgi:hypothetical protein
VAKSGVEGQQNIAFILQHLPHRVQGLEGKLNKCWARCSWGLAGNSCYSTTDKRIYSFTCAIPQRCLGVLLGLSIDIFELDNELRVEE